MKGVIYKCEVCDKLTQDTLVERWVEMSSSNGTSTINRGQQSLLKIRRDEPLHFCSARCFLTYIGKLFTKESIPDDITEQLLEMIENGEPVKVGDMTITPIDKFKLELNGEIPSDIWSQQVKEFGLNPDDFLVESKSGSIINIYKAYYYDDTTK